MIPKGEKWHYIAVKYLSRLFHGITPNDKGDRYYLSRLHSVRTEQT